MRRPALCLFLGLLVIPAYALGLVYVLSSDYPQACDPAAMQAFVRGSNMLLMGLIPALSTALLLVVVDACRQRGAHCCPATPLWCMALPNFATSVALQSLASVELSSAGCLSGAWRSGGVLSCLLGEWLLSALMMVAVVLLPCWRHPAAPRYQELPT